MQHFADHAGGGEWFHCGACGAAGDMIELSARVWGLNGGQAIAKLRNLGHGLPDDPAAVRDYLAVHWGVRRRTATLWKMAQKALVRPTGELDRLIWQLNLGCEIPWERCIAGPGGILGGIDTSAVERCFAPKSMQHADARPQRGNPSEHRTFRGVGWGEVLVMPFFDLPGRIAAFQFLGRDGDPATDAVFKLVNRQFRGNQHAAATFEAGLATHPRVLEVADGMGRVLVATDRWLTAAQLQMRHFEGSHLPLPLVVWHDSRQSPRGGGPACRVRTYHAWEMIGNRTVVFWMPKFSVATLRQAIERDALISTVGPDGLSPEKLQKFIWKFRPDSFCQYVSKGAVPWPQALARQIERMTEAQLEQLYHRLESEGLDAAHILRRCGQAVAARSAGLGKDAGQRTARLGRFTIVERADAWYAKRSKDSAEELIAEAVLRVDEAIYHERQKCTFARGRILYRGREFEFVEDMKVMQRGGLGWVRQQLIERRAGFLQGDSTWSNRLLDLARLFHQPKLTSAVERVGWDDDQQAFVFPRFRISSAGAVKELGEPLPGDLLPARRLEAPGIGLSPTDVDLNGATNSTIELFWAVAASILANILATPFHCERVPIGLLGPGAIAVGEAVAGAMGCLCHEVGGVADVRQCRELATAHGWPLLVKQARTLRKPARRQLLREAGASRNVILPIDLHEVEAAGADGWIIVVGDEPTQLGEDVQELAALLPPAYLRDLGDRRLAMKEPSRRDQYFECDVLDDLAAFVSGCFGNPEAVLAAKQRFLAANDAATARQLATAG